MSYCYHVEPRGSSWNDSRDPSYAIAALEAAADRLDPSRKRRYVLWDSIRCFLTMRAARRHYSKG